MDVASAKTTRQPSHDSLQQQQLTANWSIYLIYPQLWETRRGETFPSVFWWCVPLHLFVWTYISAHGQTQQPEEESEEFNKRLLA